MRFSNQGSWKTIISLISYFLQSLFYPFICEPLLYKSVFFAFTILLFTLKAQPILIFILQDTVKFGLGSNFSLKLK